MGAARGQCLCPMPPLGMHLKPSNPETSEGILCLHAGAHPGPTACQAPSHPPRCPTAVSTQGHCQDSSALHCPGQAQTLPPEGSFGCTTKLATRKRPQRGEETNKQRNQPEKTMNLSELGQIPSSPLQGSTSAD